MTAVRHKFNTMALLMDFLSGVNFPPVTLMKRYLEDGVPDDMQPLTHCPTDWCLKSSSKSSELRERGNEAYRSKQYDEALKYYSLSIATAPTDSIELALAYGNRSAILQVQKEYELCLLDTNRALDGSIPQSSRMTLLERKAVVWDKLQEENDMRKKLRAGLPNLKCSSLLRGNIMACESTLCYISEADIDDADLVPDRSRIHPDFETAFKNDICGNLSPKVQRIVDEEWGQTFIATEDIEPGEILSNDHFYALVVQDSNLHEYCSYCSVWCKALIPCVSCSKDMYCCVGCREKAYDAYHETECKLLPLWSNISPSKMQARRLFLRVFLTGTKQGRDLTNLLNDPQVYAALNGNLDSANVRFSSKDYIPILNTFWKGGEFAHPAQRRNRMKEVLEIFTGLRYVKYFGSDGNTETQYSGNFLTGEELMAIVLLVHNSSIGLTHCYYISAYFWKYEGEGPLIFRRHALGTAVGPWHTFLNQSCAPNAMKLASGRRVLFRSIKPIKAGEQIFRSSSMYYAHDTSSQRRIHLKLMLGRECSCIACVEDWPSLNELLMSRNRYVTSNRAVIKKIEKMQNWLHKKIDEYSISEEDVKKVLEFCKTVHRYMNEPSYPIIQCEDFLRHAMNARGNLYISQEDNASLYNYL